MAVVANPLTLPAVLKTAARERESVIHLAPGAYRNVSLSRLSAVTIASQDPKRPAQFRTLNVSQCEDLKLENLAIELTPDAKTLAHTSAVRVFRSSGVTLRRLTISCGAAVVGVAQDADPNLSRAAVGDNVLGLPTGRGITVDQSSDVLIEACGLSKLHKGVVLNKASDVVIRRCDIGEVRTSPIVGTSLGPVTIAANRLHTARPWNFGGKGDHGDFIHIWTARTDTAPAGPLVIADNLIDQADGAAILGVFLEDQSGLGFPDVEIARNVILNGNAQGLALSNTRARIFANTLLQTSGTSKQAPSILLRGAAMIEARGNTLHDVYGTLRKLSAPSIETGNKVIRAGPRSAAELDDHRAAWTALHRSQAAAGPRPAPQNRRSAFDAIDETRGVINVATAYLRLSEA